MTGFRCIPITTETAERFRGTGRDDRGNTMRRMVAADGGFPCRHCLCMAAPGEAVLLGSYNLLEPQGIYWTPSPIFVHEAACPRFTAADTVAEIIGARLVSVRAYDAEGMCLYDLGQVCDGTGAATPIRHALADDRTAFLNVHTARPGCLLCRVERA